MQPTATVCLYGKSYTFPSDWTVMQAMESVGLQTLHSNGCRSGVCGACAFLYRLDGKLHGGLACQTLVADGMNILEMPLLSSPEAPADFHRLQPNASVLREQFPALDACTACGVCDRVCPQQLKVQQIVAAAREGNIRRCAEQSFLCVMCGLCTLYCPAGINQSQVAMLARRLNGRLLSADDEPRGNSTFSDALRQQMNASVDEAEAAYENRDFEP